MITMYLGSRGRGKTLSMVKDTYRYLQLGWKVYSNVPMTFKHLNKKFEVIPIESDEILSLNKESEIEDALIVLDEVQILFDSRRAMKKENLSFSNFLQQIRKRNIDILCTTQFSGTTDNRLRQHCDIIAKPKHLKNKHLCEVNYIDMTSIEDSFNNNILIPPKITKIVFNAQPFYRCYNTKKWII